MELQPGGVPCEKEKSAAGRWKGVRGAEGNGPVSPTSLQASSGAGLGVKAVPDLWPRTRRGPVWLGSSSGLLPAGSLCLKKTSLHSALRY